MKYKWETTSGSLDLCPKCNSVLEVLVDDSKHQLIHKERCPKGCFIHHFDTKEKED